MENSEAMTGAPGALASALCRGPAAGEAEAGRRTLFGSPSLQPYRVQNPPTAVGFDSPHRLLQGKPTLDFHLQDVLGTHTEPAGQTHAGRGCGSGPLTAPAGRATNPVPEGSTTGGPLQSQGKHFCPDCAPREGKG